MPIKTVLVTGVDDPNNHYIRLCLDNFLKPTHVPWQSPKSIPKLDAAIIAATSVGHGLQWDVKDLYEGRPIFFANGGVSSIKEEFEKAVWGEGTLAKMRSGDIPFTMKVYFVLGRFFNRGDSLEFKTFKEKIDKITKHDSKTNLSNIFSVGKDKGMFAGGKSKGQWIFKGLTQRAYDDMLKYGLFLEKDALLVPEGSTEILTPTMHVPELITVNAPEPTLLPIAPEPEPVQSLPTAHMAVNEVHPALELLLEQSAKQDAKIEELLRIVNLQQKVIQGLEERISDRMESTLRVHDKLFQLDERLRGLDSETIGKATGMLSFVLENFTPRKVITPATPRQLS